MDNDFYIGWQDKAPASNVKATKGFILIVALTVIGFVALWVLNQRGFANSTFELGKLSTVEGVLIKKPAPMLQILENNQRKSILLVGFGKASAEATVEAIEKAQKQDLEGKPVRLNGTLIYYQDKTVMELTQGIDAFEGLANSPSFPSEFRKNFGSVSLKGEILDPKCALGVMKPGYGKPHRSCAVRCISGGITPIFRFTNKDGASNYCIIKGLKDESINEAVLPYVADQLRLCGNLSQQDDWLVFNIDPHEDILRLKPHWAEGDIPMCNTNQ